MLEQYKEKFDDQQITENNELLSVNKIIICNENKERKEIKETEDLYFPCFVLGYN
jgi:hypothetical protein